MATSQGYKNGPMSGSYGLAAATVRILALCMYPGRKRVDYDAALELIMELPDAKLIGPAPKGLAGSGVLIELPVPAAFQSGPPDFSSWNEWRQFLGVVDITPNLVEPYPYEGKESILVPA